MKHILYVFFIQLLLCSLLSARTVSFEAADGALRRSLFEHQHNAGIVAVEYFDINGVSLLEAPNYLAHFVDDEMPDAAHSFRVSTSRNDTRVIISSPFVVIPHQDDPHYLYELSLDNNNPYMLFVRRLHD